MPEHETLDDDEFVLELAAVHPYLLAYARCQMSDQSLAYDVVQEASLVLWKKRADFAKGTSFRAWAYRITHFQVLAMTKTLKRRGWLVFSSEFIESVREELETAADGETDRQLALQECLGKLKPNDRELVRVRYESDETLATYGAQAGRSEDGLKQSLRRIRRQLGECIEGVMAGTTLDSSSP